MSVRAIEAEVRIKSGVQAEWTIGREVIVEVHEDVNLESLTVTANGNYTPAEGIDGFSDVTVSVPERVPVTESLSVTENGTYEPDTGIDGYDRVVVSVPPTVPEIEALTITEDGTYQSSGDGYNPVTVNTGVGALRQEIASAETASGCSPLTEGLTALTTYANEVTGQEDETLSDAVESLVHGFGGGNAKSVQVTAENELYQNATFVRDWLLSVVPLSSFAVIYRNDFVYNRQETRGQGTFLLGVIINNTPALAMRFYSQLTVISTWTSNMWLSVDAGDVYTILYVE
jgi:hypothetical protein